MFKKVFSSIVIIVFIAIGTIWLLDYDKVKKGLEPTFCIKKQTYTYDDGETKVCKGMGYVIYEYKRTSNTKTVVGPFWFKLEQ